MRSFEENWNAEPGGPWCTYCDEQADTRVFVTEDEDEDGKPACETCKAESISAGLCTNRSAY
jgi:hypothetical protein